MRYDFSLVEDEDNLAAIPEGVYLCRIAEVRDGRARDGSVQWGMRLEVVDGEYAGRTAAWDRLTWSERGVRRVKRVLAALGFDVEGPIEIGPEDLVGRIARVTCQLEEWEDSVTGSRIVRLRVPYRGFEPADPEEADVDLRGGKGESSSEHALENAPESASRTRGLAAG